MRVACHRGFYRARLLAGHVVIGFAE
jgi:hypothetical protein